MIPRKKEPESRCFLEKIMDSDEFIHKYKVQKHKIFQN